MDATATSDGEAGNVSTVSTLRRIGETVLSTFHNRLELLTLELKEEKYWLISALMLGACVVVFAILLVVAILITVAVLAPPEARLWLLPGICLIFLAGLAASILGLRRRLLRPAPLGGTLAELKKDLECLKN